MCQLCAGIAAIAAKNCPMSGVPQPVARSQPGVAE